MEQLEWEAVSQVVIASMNISYFEDSYFSKKKISQKNLSEFIETWVPKTKYIYLHLAGRGWDVLEKERSADVQRWSSYVSGAEFQGTEEGQVNTETVRSR